jgi:hypothetical protein
MRITYRHQELAGFLNRLSEKPQRRDDQHREGMELWNPSSPPIIVFP